MARLNDGFKTLMSFALSSSVLFWQKEVQPVGISAGGEIDTTTMNNTAWRTKFPKSLKTATEATLTVSYDPQLYSTILTMLGKNQLITVTFPDTHTVAFWGWVDTFVPAGIKEGELPLAEIKVHASNQNNSFVEVAPAWT